MIFKNILSDFFSQKTAKCDEKLPLEDILEEKLSIEDEEAMEEKSHYIPSYQFVFQPIKVLTMSNPGIEINGFKFSLGTPLSHSFFMSHTINMAPKKQQVSTGNPMMDMFAEKTPYYALGAQYHHIDTSSQRPHIFYSLVGQVNSTGRLDAIYSKNFKNYKLKIQTGFLNSNVAFAQSSVEVEHSSENAKQTVTLSKDFLNYNNVEKIGNRLLFGVDFMYIVPRNLLTNGFLCRYVHKPNQKFFFNYSGMSQAVNFGGWFKLNESTALATELEFGGPGVSDAILGFRSKSKNYEVNSSVKTSGEIKSIFAYEQAQMYKLKLFLGGNLFSDDFKSGFSFSVGQGEE